MYIGADDLIDGAKIAYYQRGGSFTGASIGAAGYISFPRKVEVFAFQEAVRAVYELTNVTTGIIETFAASASSFDKIPFELLSIGAAC